MAVLVHRANMHSEPPDWISCDGIHMIDETASVTWIKMRVWGGGLDGFFSFFYLIQLLSWVRLQVCIQIPTHVGNLNVIDDLCVCVHVQIGTQAWEHFTARDRAQLTTVKRFTVGRKTNRVLCSIVHRPPSRPPPSPLRSPFPLRSRLKIYVGHVDKSLSFYAWVDHIQYCSIFFMLMRRATERDRCAF